MSTAGRSSAKLGARQVMTPAMKRHLAALVAAEGAGDHDGAEIVCEGLSCWRGDDRISRSTVKRMLLLTLISASSVPGCTEVYTVNDAGRAVLRRPELAQELQSALRRGAPFTLGADDRVQALSDRGDLTGRFR